MSSQARVPQSKFDLEAVITLQQATPEALIPLVPELLSWLQDINWPVAAPVAAVLVGVGEPLIPHLRPILKSDDDMWIYWVLQNVVAALPVALQQQLEPELQALAGQGERAENDIIALKLLADLPSTDVEQLCRRVRNRRRALLDLADDLADLEHELNAASRT